MNNILEIRQRLGLSQAAFAAAVGMSPGNISHYETGRQGVPERAARKIIRAANDLGVPVTFDDVYRKPEQRATDA